MARVEPLDRATLPDSEDRLQLVEQAMGFVPNSMLTMARVPGLLDAFSSLGAVVLRNGLIAPELTQMVAQVASQSAGCRYCQAHTAHTAARLGVDEAKLADLWVFETSEHFDDAERAALRLAHHAGSVPNQATDEDFDQCRKYYDDDQISAIVAVIAFFGFLNRWNDTIATELEESPTEFGRRVLAERGWEPGKHTGAPIAPSEHVGT